MRRALVLSLCLVLAGVPLWASAQDPDASAVVAPAQSATLPADPGYVGVVPGRAAVPTHLLGRPGATPTVVTWPGFQPRADGASRFFLQLTSRAQYEARSESGRFVVTLRGVRIPDRQTRRLLDTRFFNTAVVTARLERRGRRDVAFVFELRADVTPTVSLEVAPDGYTFVFIEFPAGHWLPREEPVAAPAGQLGTISTTDTPPATSPPDAPAQAWVDPERPPGASAAGSRRGPQ